MNYRDHNFLGTTQSLCPECLELVPAKVISRESRVYFRKRCPTHGLREDFVCSDVNWFDLTEYSLPGKVPLSYGTEVSKGCPYDCGLCSEHEQHTCIGLLEITSSCNLECPMCFAVSGPGGNHVPYEDCARAIDRLVEVEGQPEVLQLSGGEPTIHPDFDRLLRYACDQPIDIVMVNTNGVRIAKDPGLVEHLAEFKHRIEIYLQFDGFDEQTYELLRGESLLDSKLRAVEELGRHGIRTILVSTVQPGINDHQIGRLVKFATERTWVTGVSFQPATYSGRFVLPETLEQRITFPDIITAIADQTETWRPADFSPLPCAHPNGHTLAYAYRWTGKTVPLARFVEFNEHLDLLSGRITFSRTRAKELIAQYLARQTCGTADCGGAIVSPPTKRGADLKPDTLAAAQDFFRRALTEQLNPEDMLRITTTSFMDAYNFDIRQLMKSCVHFVLPSGHLVPFSAYNVLYRDEHVSLPSLTAVPVEVTL